MTTIKKLTILLLVLLLGSPARADEPTDTAFMRLYQEYFKLYGEDGKEKEFYAASDKMLEHFREKGQLDRYYKIRMNEVLYDTEHNQPFRAIKRANKMLDDMKANNVRQFDVVYLSLGTIFESRGNYRMADHYYKEAINYINNQDVGSQIGIYSRLAFLKMFREPDEAEKWNEKNGEKSREVISEMPAYYQVYLSIKACIAFAKGDKNGFMKAEKEYQDFRKQYADQLDNYGLSTMEIIQEAFDGKYQSALAKINKGEGDLPAIDRYDMMLHIYEMTGDKDKALDISRQRANAIDSLNSNLLFDNLNEINVEMNVAKMKQEAAETRIRYFIIVTVMLVFIIFFLVCWILARRRARKQLIEKNAQLETALEMAEEANKMKASFIRNVTHEIRTPLNSINGFTQLINNPNFELTAEEKKSMTENISQNVKNITQIVDEILQIADKESNNIFPKNDTINCNHFFKDTLDKVEDSVNAGVELKYQSDLGTNFTIKTNEAALRRVVSHLLENAAKFTEKGSITLSCHIDAENDGIRIDITDTGIGIPKDKQNKIFERFYKVDTFSQGIGLGLSVSKMIAQKLGGDLRIDESYTNGSRFVLTVPI